MEEKSHAPELPDVEVLRLEKILENLWSRTSFAQEVDCGFAPGGKLRVEHGEGFRSLVDELGRSFATILLCNCGKRVVRNGPPCPVCRVGWYEEDQLEKI